MGILRAHVDIALVRSVHCTGPRWHRRGRVVTMRFRNFCLMPTTCVRFGSSLSRRVLIDAKGELDVEDFESPKAPQKATLATQD